MDHSEIHRSIGSRLLALIVACNSMLVSVRTSAATDTNIYRINTSLVADDDGGVTRDRYANYYHANHAMMFNGLSSPLPEQLPASFDSNGHWGPVVNGWQLSVRFHHGEFLTNEPAVAMITIRNVNAPLPSIFRRWSASDTRKNFRYALHHGTNALTWSWTDPLPDPAPPGAPVRRHFGTAVIAPGSQTPFFVRLDQIFDLSQAGQYSLQVSWPERATTVESLIYRESGTNIVSGVATLRVVDKLSDAELEARKTQEQTHEAAKRAAAELRQKGFQFLWRRAMTNKPPVK